MCMRFVNKCECDICANSNFSVCPPARKRMLEAWEMEREIRATERYHAYKRHRENIAALLIVIGMVILAML